MIVGGGVVLAASYEAKARGVRTAMGCSQARRLCPDAVVVPPRMSAYTEASRAVFAVFDDTTPLVEGLSIDEAFLDVRGMERISGTPRQIAARLRRRVREQVGLPITVGVARTKFLAKVASGVAKPDGLLIVPPAAELGFLHPLPGRAAVGCRAGDGREAARPRHHHGRRGRAARASTRSSRCSAARRAASCTRSHTTATARRVTPGRRRRSMGTQRALGRRADTSPAALDTALVGLVDRLTRRLRAARRLCRTVTIRLRFDDFSRATRSHTLWRVDLPDADDPRDRARAARHGDAADRAPGHHADRHRRQQPHRRPRAVQLALPFDRETASALDAVVDDVRDRYGPNALTRAVLLGRDLGLSVRYSRTDRERPRTLPRVQVGPVPVARAHAADWAVALVEQLVVAAADAVALPERERRPAADVAPP